MDDLIDRQQAIDEFWKLNIETRPSWIDAVMTMLKSLPSAQPERKKGKWIDYTEDCYVECPFCHSATNCDDNKDELHFCFSCGADMRGKKDD